MQALRGEVARDGASRPLPGWQGQQGTNERVAAPGLSALRLGQQVKVGDGVGGGQRRLWGGVGVDARDRKREGAARPCRAEVLVRHHRLTTDGLVLHQQAAIEQELAHDVDVRVLQIACPRREMQPAHYCSPRWVGG